MNLTTFDLVSIIINKFKNENIYYFSLNELEQQLNYFAQNEKYGSLFNDIEGIKETINYFLMYGYLYSVSANNDTIYIIRIDQNINYNELLEDALNSYCNIKKICNQYKNLNIYLNEPDGTYIHVDGIINKKNVKWTIQTDGIIKNKGIKLIKGIKHLYKSPFKEEKVFFDRSDFDIIDIEKSTYVLRQEIINNEVNNSLLYTNITNINDIDDIAKVYCKK